MTVTKLPPIELHNENAPRTPLKLVVDSGTGEDSAALNAVKLAKVQTILARYTDNTPTALPLDAYTEVADLLYQMANPSNRIGRAISNTGPDYPTKWLPAPMLAQLGAAGSLSHGGIGAAMLGYGSAAAMPARLITEGTQQVIPTEWVPMIGYANSAKTPCMKVVGSPFEDHEKIESRRYSAEMVHWFGMDQKERKQFPHPIDNSRIAADATMEAIVRQMAGNGGYLALISDELSGILRGIGQYKKDGGADKAKMLELWSASPWRYRRVGNGNDSDGIFFYVEEPIMPMFGTIQPEFVHLLGDVGSGMQARWMPHYCRPREGTAIGRTADEWAATVRVMLANKTRARQWTMPTGSDARTEHLAAEERWYDEALDVSQTPTSSGFLGKAGEHAARTALVLAEIGAAGDIAATGSAGRIEAGELPEWAMRAAIDTVDYCAGVWRALPNTETALTLSNADKNVAERDGMLNAWLHGREGGSATKNEIHQAHVAGARDSKAVNALIERHIAIYGEDSVVPEPRRSVRVFAR